MGKLEDASTMIENCWKKLKLAKSISNKLNLQLGEIDDLLGKIPKPKKKKTEGPLLVNQKMLMKMLMQFSTKKKRKHSDTDDSQTREEDSVNNESEK
jgi:hypothetical protein